MQAGFPPGVFNLVNGDGAGVGAHLTAHPDVDMVSFTGSTRAGVAISKAAAETVKRVSLELGGKGANIIFADADEKAVTRGVRHCFNNSGQSCNAPTRMLVERAIYDQAVETARTIAEKTEVGPADIEGRQIGRLCQNANSTRSNILIKQRHRRRRHACCGWPWPPRRAEPRSLSCAHDLCRCHADMTIWKEEIFGPVLV